MKKNGANKGSLNLLYKLKCIFNLHLYKHKTEGPFTKKKTYVRLFCNSLYHITILLFLIQFLYFSVWVSTRALLSKTWQAVACVHM